MTGLPGESPATELTFQWAYISSPICKLQALVLMESMPSLQQFSLLLSLEDEGETCNEKQWEWGAKFPGMSGEYFWSPEAIHLYKTWGSATSNRHELAQLFCFVLLESWTVPNSVHGLLLVLYSEITPRGVYVAEGGIFRRSQEVSGIKPGSAYAKLSLCSLS